MRIEEIKDYVDSLNIPYSYEGNPALNIQTYCPLKHLKNSAITWVRNIDDINDIIFNAYSDILLVANIEYKRTISSVNVLWVDNPHRTFFKILEHFFSNIDPENVGTGIALSAVVETPDIGENVFVGHQCYIGKDVKIDDDVKIHNNVSIEGNVVIGKGTVIASGTRIGVCGYGHYMEPDGSYQCVPHLGGVQIGKNVRIGANVCIARGCLDDTIIEDNVRINNLSHIAHNTHIGKNTMITAGVIICGSTVVGENDWLSPGTIFTNGIEVGNNCQVGLGALATKSLPPNGVYFGIPAKKIRDRE